MLPSLLQQCALTEICDHYQMSARLRAHPIPAYFFIESKYAIAAAEASVKACTNKAEVAKTRGPLDLELADNLSECEMRNEYFNLRQ